MQTFINLPSTIADTISTLLTHTNVHELNMYAKRLHDRYTNRGNGKDDLFIHETGDILAYVSLRFPATYAQISSALVQIQERIPSWQPKTILDLGCGPGTGIFAAKTIWPSIASGVGIDQAKNFLTMAEKILHDAQMNIDLTWTNSNILNWMKSSETKTYDLILVGNVFNELPEEHIGHVLNRIAASNSGVVLILEPGTSSGYELIQKIAGKISTKEYLIAPYIDNTFIESTDYWIHFPQRFQRPEFQRRIRQSMREESLMASDWEEAKYSYVAWGNIPMEKKIWGQSIGHVQISKGFLSLPILTKEGIIKPKILKRHKQLYSYAKKLAWGEIIAEKTQIEPIV